MNKNRQNKILGEIVEVLRKNGVKVESPYDVKNFLTDWGKSDDFLMCGKFADLIDEEE